METKQRHGCVTAWLILIIIFNSLSAILYFFAGEMVAENFPGGISDSMMILLAILGIGNVIFHFCYSNGKKLDSGVLWLQVSELCLSI